MNQVSKWMKWCYFSFAFMAFQIFAVPITSTQARTAVNNWLRIGDSFSCPLGRKVESSKVCKTKEGAIFHVVKLEGKGFVITSANTQIEPIIAFSSGKDLIEDDENPLWCLLKGDLAAREKAMRAPHSLAMGIQLMNANEERWNRLLNSTPKMLSDGKNWVTDLRVPPLLQSQWSQQSKGNSYDPNHENKCYNYYTPSNYPCGCVATAGAQIMRYHRYPTTEVTPGAYSCAIKEYVPTEVKNQYQVVERPIELTMQGGFYNWSKMPLCPKLGITDEECREIGKLTSDIGISCLMSYGPNGSGASPICLAKSLVNRFHYSNAKYLRFFNQKSEYQFPYTLKRLKKALIPNLDAKLPVDVGVSSTDGGHAIIADGYGYDNGDFYVHFNFGWAGMSDAWYLPPNIDEFTAIDCVIYNIFPTQTEDTLIISGRILTELSSEPIKNVTVSTQLASGKTVSCKTNNKGIYALILPAGTYTLTADSGLEKLQKNITVTEGVYLRTTDNGAYYRGPQSIGNQCAVNFVMVDTPPSPLPTFEESLDIAEMSFTRGGDAQWFVQEDEAHDDVAAAQSGPITGNQSSWFETQVTGPGVISFWWKASSESGYFDYLEFLVDGNQKAKIGGMASLWQQKSFDIPAGSHVLRWNYRKDGSGDKGWDCGWVDEISWSGSMVATTTTEVPVPYSWLDQYGLNANGDYEAAANARAANGIPVWECFEAGLDPTNAFSKFIAKIEMVNGKPVITWEPDLGSKRIYTIEGVKALGKPWTSPPNTDAKFFRVRVQLPKRK